MNTSLRIAAIATVVVVLLGLLAWSQLRPRPRRVSATIEADAIRLGSRVGGRVAAVLVEEGQEVAAGDKLVELEPYDLLERLAQAKAEAAARKAALDKLTEGFRTEEIAQADARLRQFEAERARLENLTRQEELEAAEAEVVLAQARLDRAAKNLARVTELRRNGGVATDEQVERATEEQSVAAAALDAAQAQRDLLKSGARQEDIQRAVARVDEAKAALKLLQGGYRPEEIDQARAEVEAAEAAVRALHEQLRELTIAAPAAGMIEALELNPGDLVAAGAPVLSMIQEDELWARAYVPQAGLDLQLGRTVVVTVDAYPQRRFQAEITYIAQQGEFTPSNVQTLEERSKQVFRIKATIRDPQGLLSPGMTADLWLDPAEAEAWLPAKAE